MTFASEEELLELLGLTPGAVTPLGLLHDTACRVRFYLDQDFLEEPGIIGIHPNDNTATVWLKTRELVELIRRHGTPTEIVPF
ncbi:MAG: YbaK/EbsC family protein [Acutalibacteraceae bacterium]